eukprot:m.245570 g.245570  ORF g.245570 m.245570 type:complete len:478 (+) comp40256_c0_seq14:2761-4194(+)
MIAAFRMVLLLYSNNMLCTESRALFLIGQELLDTIKQNYSQHLIWGCRHMDPPEQRPDEFQPLPDCLQQHNSGTLYAFEKISDDMLIRVNNVSALIEVVPMLHDHLVKIAKVSSPSFPLTPPDSGMGSAETSAGPRDTAMSHSSSQSASSYVSKDGPAVSEIISHLVDIQDCQIRLICHRMDCFLKPSLHMLLSLDLPENQYSLEKRLDPTLKYLTRHLSALADGLYPKCFTRLLQCLWSNLVQTFKEFAEELVKSKTECLQKAQLASRTVARLIDFFYADGAGLDLDTLTSDYVLQILELVLLPTNRLVSVYKQIEATSKRPPSVNDSSVRPLSPLSVADLRANLHSLRKCFSGQELVDQVNSLQESKSSASSASDDDGDTALDICRRLVENKTIYSVDSGVQSPDSSFVADEEHSYRFCDQSPGTILLPARRTRNAGDLSESGCRVIDASFVWKVILGRSKYDRLAKEFIRSINH